MSTRPVCCFSSSPEPSTSSWSWTCSADTWQGKRDSMSLIEGSLLGFNQVTFRLESMQGSLLALFFLCVMFHVWFVSFETYSMIISVLQSHERLSVKMFVITFFLRLFYGCNILSFLFYFFILLFFIANLFSQILLLLSFVYKLFCCCCILLPFFLPVSQSLYI